MADNILEKEQLDTKETDIQEPISTITVNDSVQVASDNTEAESHNNIIDNLMRFKLLTFFNFYTKI